MDPLTAWNLTKTAGEISTKLYEFGKNLKDRDLKKQADDILDQVRELKNSAAKLEDENRELREKLRFKTDDFEFRTPFYYEKAHPNTPLCPKCFSQEIAAPMGEQGQDCDPAFRRCLVCGVTNRVIPRGLSVPSPIIRSDFPF